MSPDLEPMTRDDWVAVRGIYREGIENGDATFETETPGWEEWDRRHLDCCRIVARRDGAVVGWAALAGVSERPVYRGVAEVSVYVGERHQGGGFGQALLERVIAESEEAGLWTLQAGVFPENEASLELHRRVGFREVGRRERIGRQGSRWRDLVLLERRSRVVGWEDPA